jgi:hypothetical protein
MNRQTPETCSMLTVGIIIKATGCSCSEMGGAGLQIHKRLHLVTQCSGFFFSPQAGDLRDPHIKVMETLLSSVAVGWRFFSFLFGLATNATFDGSKFCSRIFHLVVAQPLLSIFTGTGGRTQVMPCRHELAFLQPGLARDTFTVQALL